MNSHLCGNPPLVYHAEIRLAEALSTVADRIHAAGQAARPVILGALANMLGALPDDRAGQFAEQLADAGYAYYESVTNSTLAVDERGALYRQLGDLAAAAAHEHTAAVIELARTIPAGAR